MTNIGRMGHIFSAGLAMFAMLFGSGNVVFPLALGRDVGGQVWFALGGLIITAVVIPLVGMVSSMLADGDYKKLLGIMGPIPAAIIAFISMILIGPFCIIPRCLTVAYAAVELYLPSISLLVFTLAAAVILFATTFRQTAVVSIIERFLGPAKLIMLMAIIVFGMYWSAPLVAVEITPWNSYLKGLLEGYWTLDLFGVIFFSGLILNHLRKSMHIKSTRQLALVGLQAGGVGAVLLGVIYAGFCLVAAMYSVQVAGVDTYKILTVLADLVLGKRLGILANIAMALSCFTTAIALTAVFTEYLRREIFRGTMSYVTALLITIAITTAMANLGFATIMATIKPVVVLIYPALTVLVVANMAYHVFGFKYVKTPVVMTFMATLLAWFW